MLIVVSGRMLSGVEGSGFQFPTSQLPGFKWVNLVEACIKWNHNGDDYGS